uniref:Sex-regulated protein janus-A n=1 Tax=Romanomermis culicivorax TaxID=13658 RepID=A0A915KQ48_ROMCU
MESISDVDIDPQGRFKYILIKVVDPISKVEKYIVRGYGRCEYHADIYDEVEPEIKKAGLKSICEGGGRILHENDKKKLTVFGYSTGYGKADHAKSVEILKKKFVNYQVDWSNDGY